MTSPDIRVASINELAKGAGIRLLGDGIYKFSATTVDTNTAPVFNIAVSSNSSITATVVANGIVVAGPLFGTSLSIRTTMRVKNINNVVAIGGNLELLQNNDPGLSAGTVTMTPSGNYIVISVTGAADGNTMLWTGTVTMVY